MLLFQVIVDLGAIAMNGYSVFPKAPVLLESYHQIVLVSYLGHSFGGLTPLQRCRWCILQPQPTGKSIRWLEDYIKKNKERLIKTTRNNTNNTNNTSNNRTIIHRKQKWEVKSIVWMFPATNKRNLTREDLDMAENGETLREKLNLF